MKFEEFHIEPLMHENEEMVMSPYMEVPAGMQPPLPTPHRGAPMPTHPIHHPTQPTHPTHPQEPPVLTDQGFIQGYLRTIIGRYVKVEFILGTNMFIDREGTLVSVGIDHIVLREPQTNNNIIADLYSIKFVKVYY